MLVLFETPAGYAVFKVQNESALKKVDNIWEEFSTAEKAQENLELVAFKRFKDVAEAVKSSVAIDEGKLSKTLKSVLKKKVGEVQELAVGDTKLGNIIKEKLEIKCINNPATVELLRGIRANADALLSEYQTEISAMRLALSHSLARYKVKFNPEKIDTMIVQAVSLLDDLDKEINNYAMRVREWYGWHFPELSKLVTDHMQYARLVKTIGMKKNAQEANLDDIVSAEKAIRVKEEAEISMGTDISDLDLIHIVQLCDQIIELTNYRIQLHEYLKNRMNALAPNLTVLLGELVGARLISRAGSLVGLAKFPASTVQILGAEKALFRALKTKKDTPKYGIIYHAQLVSQSSTAVKGKIARKLSAKVSLSARIDALCDESLGNEAGIESRALIERVVKEENEYALKRTSKPGGSSFKFKKEAAGSNSRKRTFEDTKPIFAKKFKKEEANENDENA